MLPSINNGVSAGADGRLGARAVTQMMPALRADHRAFEDGLPAVRTLAGRSRVTRVHGVH